MFMKYIIVILLLGISKIACGQSRQDTPVRIDIDGISKIITNIVGWEFDGEYWCGYRNVICSKYHKNNKIPIQLTAHDITEYGRNNIINMQLKKISINNEPYYLLYIKSWSYYYDNPTLQIGRHHYKSYDIYGIDPIQYEKLWNISDSANIVHTIKIQWLGGYWPTVPSKDWGVRTSDREVIKQCYEESFNPYKEAENEYFQWKLYIKRESDGNVRFQFPTQKILINEIQEYNNKYNYLHFDKYDAVDFDRFYFETSYAQFKLLKL